MSKAEDIFARGNATERFTVEGYTSRVECTDGFSVSIIAGGGAYSTPRSAIPGAHGEVRPGYTSLGEVASDYPGPFTTVELGYPTSRPEPWQCTEWSEGHDRHEDHTTCDGFARYFDGSMRDESDGTDSVYGFVPVDMVRALIASHGGEK